MEYKRGKEKEKHTKGGRETVEEGRTRTSARRR